MRETEREGKEIIKSLAALCFNLMEGNQDP